MAEAIAQHEARSHFRRSLIRLCVHGQDRKGDNLQASDVVIELLEQARVLVESDRAQRIRL